MPGWLIRARHVLRGNESHERVTEAHVSLLLHVGLLTRHSVPGRFLFALPNAGPVVKGIIAGRKVTTYCH